MTLQIVLGGSDGLLIATDTKWTAFARGPVGRTVRSAEYGVEKVVFTDRRTIGIACSGSDITVEVGRKIAEKIDAVWNQYSGALEALCFSKWEELPQEERDWALARGENVLLLAHSAKAEAFKVSFTPKEARATPFRREKSQRLLMLGGDYLNPARLFLDRYLPTKPPSIDKLAFLAAHYILVGGQLNPAGVDGLGMYIAKDGNPFQAVSEQIIELLRKQSEALNTRIQRTLLKATLLKAVNF